MSSISAPCTVPFISYYTENNLKSEPCFSQVQSQPLCARVSDGWGPRAQRSQCDRPGSGSAGESELQAVPGKSGRRGSGCRCAGGKRWALRAGGSDGAVTEPGAERADPHPGPAGRARSPRGAKWCLRQHVPDERATEPRRVMTPRPARAPPRNPEAEREPAAAAPPRAAEPGCCSVMADAASEPGRERARSSRADLSRRDV